MKYINIDEKTNLIFNESDKEPTFNYPVTHKEIYPHGVTKTWFDREDKK